MLNWLNEKPSFFNPHSTSGAQGSGNKPGLEISDFGLAAYWSAGFSVFGATPLSNLKFTLPWQKTAFRNNSIEAYNADDEAYGFFCELSPKSPRQQLMDFRDLVVEQVENHKGEVVLPLSGGLDSRLLLWALSSCDKSKVFCFSYGTSNPQNVSYEVQVAKAMAEKHAFQWEHIQLGQFNHYFTEWLDLFGTTTHAHGMYQYEFYLRILEHRFFDNPLVISGSVGDLWAGNGSPIRISEPSDLKALFLNHGMRGHPSGLMNFRANLNHLLSEFWDGNRQFFRDPLFNVVQLARTKMMLLRYLADIPESLGFSTWRPFHTPLVALSMLKLDQKLRKNREWQRSFLRDVGFDASYSYKLTSNSLNYQAILIKTPEALQLNHARRYFSSRFIDNVQNELSRQIPRLKGVNLSLIGGGKKSALLGLSGRLNSTLWAYINYLMLVPLSDKYLEISHSFRDKQGL